MKGGRLSGKIAGRQARSLAAARNPWDGFRDGTTHGQGDGRRETVAKKGAETRSRRQKAIPDVPRSGSHQADQAGRDRPGKDRVRSHGRGGQGMARAASRGEKVAESMGAADTYKDVDLAWLMRLRTVVARLGEMDLARWWNSTGQLGPQGASVRRHGAALSRLRNDLAIRRA
jgi:hypothetical protein